MRWTSRGLGGRRWAGFAVLMGLLWATGGWGAASSLDPAMNDLRSDKKEDRLGAIRALRGSDAPQVLQALVSALGDREGGVQRAAAGALEDALKRLGDDLGSFNTDARDEATQTFSGLVRALATVLQRGDSSAQSASQRLLEEAAKEGRDQLRDLNSDVQRAATTVLAELVRALGGVIRYGDSRAQSAAADVSEGLIKALRSPLVDAASGVQLAASEVLRALAGTLREALRDGDFRAQRAARQLLGRAVDAVAEGLREREAGVRVVAANTLAEMGDPRAVALLLEGLADADAEVRAASAGAMRRLTQVDLGEDAAAWGAWWEENRVRLSEGL